MKTENSYSRIKDSLQGKLEGVRAELHVKHEGESLEKRHPTLASEWRYQVNKQVCTCRQRHEGGGRTTEPRGGGAG